GAGGLFARRAAGLRDDGHRPFRAPALGRARIAAQWRRMGDHAGAVGRLRSSMGANARSSLGALAARRAGRNITQAQCARRNAETRRPRTRRLTISVPAEQADELALN